MARRRRGCRARQALGELVAEADRRQWANQAFREELARWMRTDPAHQADGIPAHDLGIKDWMSFAGPTLIRTFNQGSGHAAHDLDVVMHSPTLVLLGTNTEDAATWMQAGQALQSVLLHAQSEGVEAGHLNQPVEVEELRPAVAEAAGVGGYTRAAAARLRRSRGPDAAAESARPADPARVMGTRIGASHLPPGGAKARNPTSENRRKSELRNSSRGFDKLAGKDLPVPLRTSAFGLPSAFGLAPPIGAFRAGCRLANQGTPPASEVSFPGQPV